MCSMARKAASAIFRADVEDEEDEENLELETPKNSSNHATTKKSGNTKTIENHDTSPPLTIPPKVESVVNNSKMQLSDLNISAFSKMSIDTMASSMATNASSIGCSMTSITTPSSLQTAASNLNDDEAGLPVITLEEVKNHFMIEDAWTVIYDRVYNVTSFLAEVCKFLTDSRGKSLLELWGTTSLSD